MVLSAQQNAKHGRKEAERSSGASTKLLQEALERAQAAQSAGRYAEAAAAYQEALAMDPHPAELWANCGMMQHFAGDYTASAQSLQKAIALKPALSAPYLFLGLDELELGKAEAALQPLQHARHLQPNDPQAEVALGRAYLALGRPRPGAEAYQAASTLDPENKQAWYGLGAAAIAIIEQDGGTLATHAPDSPWARSLYADELLQQGRTAEALDTYRIIAKVSSTAERLVLAQTIEHAAQVAKNKESAIPPATWERVLGMLRPGAATASSSADCEARSVVAHRRAGASEPPQAPAVQHRAMACSYWDGRLAQASEMAGERLAVAPQDAEALFWSVKANERRAVEALARFEQLAPQAAATFDLLGDLYRRRAQPDGALGEYSKALTIAPRDPGALLGRAAALLATGRMEEASNAAQDALTDAPKDPRLNLILAEALVERHHFAEAQPHLRAALDNMNTTADTAGRAALTARAHALLGRTEAEAGDLPAAIAELTLGLASDTDGSLSFQLSRLYRRSGNAAEARKAEERARSLQSERREHAFTAVIGSAEQVP